MLTFTSSFMLLITLCLGSQNLNTKHELNLGIGKSAAFPAGFLVGLSIVLGAASGGSTTAMLIPERK